MLQTPSVGNSIKDGLRLPVGGRQLDGVKEGIREASALVHVELLVEAFRGGRPKTAVEAARQKYLRIS